jgi:hypothetical protein
VSRRPLRTEHVGDLLPEAVGVRELHDTTAFPATARERAAVAVHGQHVVAAGGQTGPGEQPRRPGADDENAHDHSI